MERALAVAEPTEEVRDLVREAGSLAEGVGAEAVLIHVTTGEEYTARKQAMASIAGTSEPYSTADASEGAEQFVRDLADEVLSDFDLHVETAGYVGDEGAVVFEAAEEYDCDHVFLPGRKRSPTGKALFGDATQEVLLEFDEGDEN